MGDSPLAKDRGLSRTGGHIYRKLGISRNTYLVLNIFISPVQSTYKHTYIHVKNTGYGIRTGA